MVIVIMIMIMVTIMTKMMLLVYSHVSHPVGAEAWGCQLSWLPVYVYMHYFLSPVMRIAEDEIDLYDFMIIFMMQLAKRSWKSRELFYLPFQEDIHLLRYGLENNGDADNNEVNVQLYNDYDEFEARCDDDDEVEVWCDGDDEVELGAMVMMRLGAMVMAKVKRRQMSERGRICQTPLSSTNYSSLTRHASSSSSSPEWLPSSSFIIIFKNPFPFNVNPICPIHPIYHISSILQNLWHSSILLIQFKTSNFYNTSIWLIIGPESNHWQCFSLTP